MVYEQYFFTAVLLSVAYACVRACVRACVLGICGEGGRRTDTKMKHCDYRDRFRDAPGTGLRPWLGCRRL